MIRLARLLAVLAAIATVTAYGSSQHATAQSASPANQRAAIEHAVRKSGAALGVGPLRGFNIRISAVDRRFARAYSVYTAKLGLKHESASGRLVSILRRPATSWKVVFSGSEADAPPCKVAPATIRRELLRYATCSSALNGASRTFFTPGPNGASCEIDLAPMGPTAEASCRVWPPVVPVRKAIGVTLTAKGHLTGICHGMLCMSNGPLGLPLLYGRSISLGPIRCTALRGGVRCVVKKTGRGFLLSANRIEPG